MKKLYNQLTLDFLNACDQSIEIKSDIEGIALTTSELNGSKSYETYLNEDDISNLIDCLQQALEHQKKIK